MEPIVGAPMTPQEQPKEYIITEEQLNAFHRSYIPMLGIMPSEEYEHRQKVMQAIRFRPHTPAAPDCITCPKHAIGYGIGINEARLTQCNTCMFDGKRECMYHGYPDDTIPQSCEYKIGKHAVIAPIESQLHNKQHDATIRNQTLDDVLIKLKEWRMPFQKYPASIGKNEMKELIESLRHTEAQQ